jgi:hypothetical protein
MTGVRILDWAPRSSGMLRGFLDVEFPSGLRFHECAVFEKLGMWWVSPAGKPVIGRDGTAIKEPNGRAKYKDVVTFTDKSRRDLWSSVVIEALRAARPEIFG